MVDSFFFTASFLSKRSVARFVEFSHGFLASIHQVTIHSYSPPFRPMTINESSSFSLSFSGVGLRAVQTDSNLAAGYPLPRSLTYHHK